jgi:hypothetical protein
MAPIIDSIEIDRSPEVVFAYVDDLGKHREWQEQIVSVHVETDGPTRVGTRATEVAPFPLTSFFRRRLPRRCPPSIGVRIRRG